MWRSKLKSTILALNKTNLDFEKGDITATMTAHKPPEMSDPGEGLHGDCSAHPLCREALLRGYQHNKPLRDMNAKELKAAIAHRGVVLQSPLTNPGMVNLLAPLLAKYYYQQMKSTRMKKVVLDYARISAVPALITLYSTTKMPETEIARLCVAHDVVLSAVDCGHRERNLLKERLAAAAAALKNLEADRDWSSQQKPAEKIRDILAARRRLRSVEELSAVVSREVAPPVVNDDLPDDEVETLSNERRQRRLRLLPLAIRMVLGYQPPPNRKAGELFSAHNFASPAFKRSLRLVVLSLTRFLRHHQGSSSTLYSTTKMPETEIVQLCVAHGVVLSPVDCGHRERNFLKVRVAEATAALDVAKAGQVSPENLVGFFRSVLVARRRLRCVEELSAGVSREERPPVADINFSDDEDETVPSNEKRQKKQRLSREEIIRHISTFFGALDFYKFEELTGEEAFVVDNLVSVRAFCASTADTEAEIPVLGGTRPSIAKRIGILTQGANPIDAAAASKVAHHELAESLKRKRT
jgi:hypothetical protein